jgi:protein-tyrosine kinase
MSKIYEALQRADLERKGALGSVNEQFAEAMDAPEIEEAPPAGPAVVFDNIRQFRWKPSINSFPTLAERGAGVEQFRSLRSRVYQARYEAPVKTILVSSGMPAEGKSFVTSNLAMSLTRNSVNNILLIDADLRRPTLHNLLGAPNAPGLAEYLGGTADLNAIMQRDLNTEANVATGRRSITNLTFIPSGKCDDNSSELVANHRIEELIATLAPCFDWILIDSPPVLAVTDALELARAADAVLLVARGAKTPYNVAQRTQAAFASSRILGFVLNDVKGAPRRGSYYYYYGGQDDKDHEKRQKDHGKQG